jgi:cyclic beta-1,2-glucan synthetase
LIFSFATQGRAMPATPSPSAVASNPLCLLSNGRHTVMLDAAGSGFSRWRGMAVTRWREDPVTDPWGSYVLLRDEHDGTTWSAAVQPFGTAFDEDTVAFGDGRATYGRRVGDLQAMLEVAVAADADVELRRLTLVNHGDTARTLSLTSYAELVLAPAAADNAHPAFSKMFVQTAWDAGRSLLLATRRRRSDSEPLTWAAHGVQVEGRPPDAGVDHETDRARFLGRGRTLRSALAMQPGATLTGTTGCVLDPVFSLRQPVKVAPGASVRVLFWTQLADSHDDVLTLAERMQADPAGEQVFAGAQAHAMAERQRLGIDDAQAARFARWARALLMAEAGQRAAPGALARGRGGAPTLWAKGISGDRPIVLACVAGTAALPDVRDALLGQRSWQARQLGVDVVLLDASVAGDEAVQTALKPLVEQQHAHLRTGDTAVKAEIFLLRQGDIDDGLRDGLLTVARVMLGDRDAQAVDATDAAAAPPAPRPPPATVAATATDAADDAQLEFANGHGGFTDGGRAYRIDLDGDRRTPAPWVNVIANPTFGFMVSADGGGYAWSVNSQQNALTPWPNDPVSDTPHDIIYLRDDDSGALWSATALPIRVEGARYRIVHGKGWSRFHNDAHGIELELVQCVPANDPLKLSRLRLRNRSAQTRRLSVTGYVEWMLGANGQVTAPFVVTSRDTATGALLACNRWRADFADHVAFLDLGGCQHAATGDRATFLGPLGNVAAPVALADGASLDGRVGAGLDPCGAVQTQVELPPGTQLDLLFLLGDAPSQADAQTLVAKYRDIDFDAVLDDVRAQWDGLLDTVQVRTPDRAMDLMLNHWLPYQVLSCRVWARTAYYQASGAYGFRDQLQDVMALCVARPDVAREHLLRAAGRQFAEGDVQHWWLPPSGQGIRTRVSDDRGWLPYVAAHYIAVTGDTAILDETLPFLDGPTLADNATDAFFQPSLSKRTASFHEHCALAIDVSLTRGAHGLPLIGTGDWNDGMNSVGEKGRGESSWLGWFLLAVIDGFAPHAERRGETGRVARWRQYAAELRPALEQAWDGQWYRRGYYDDGTPLGSHENPECRIDCIAQSWSLMAGATDRQHSAQAMASVDTLLVDHAHEVARLFTPPFDHSDKNPGYIKGYPPGVRENGGQYTHGAIWSVYAWAALGDGERAAALFDLLNPIHHSDTPAALQRYKVEPYVACADVYSVEPHVGRGGWTWYSGSAGWLYRAGLEAVLGFHLRGKRLLLDPCIPHRWRGFELRYRHRGAGHVTCHEIAVENPSGVCRGVNLVELDGVAQSLDATGAASIPLADDGHTHRVRVVLG